VFVEVRLARIHVALQVAHGDDPPSTCSVIMAKKKEQAVVSIYPDWCKGCGVCVAFCPGHVLELGPDGKARVIQGASCRNCGFCEYHCPDFAIVVKTKRSTANKEVDHAHEG
jgi:2-oxoglutarate ferredoxin oxidoreductase subunit delta